MVIRPLMFSLVSRLARDHHVKYLASDVKKNNNDWKLRRYFEKCKHNNSFNSIDPNYYTRSFPSTVRLGIWWLWYILEWSLSVQSFKSNDNIHANIFICNCDTINKFFKKILKLTKQQCFIHLCNGQTIVIVCLIKIGEYIDICKVFCRFKVLRFDICSRFPQMLSIMKSGKISVKA